MQMPIYSPDYDPKSGYGHMTRAIIHELERRGVSVSVFSTPDGKISYGNDDRLNRLLDQPIQPMLGGLLLGYPTLHERYGNLANHGRRLALTMFEGSALPDGWVEALNACDAVIVPTERNAQIFKANGVNVPIHTIALGVDECFDVGTPLYHHTHHELRLLSYKRKVVNGRLIYRPNGTIATRYNPFVFVTWGDRNDRKGWDLALQAFVKAFKHRDDVRLVIKSRKSGHGIPFKINIDGVQVISEDLDDATLNDFYLRCDAMVFPSRGEGFGLPPREFARTGGASIVTDWWCYEDAHLWGYPVGYQLDTAWRGYPNFSCGGQWAVADVDDLAENMKEVFYAPPHKLAEQGEWAMRYVKDKMQWSKFIDGVLSVWGGLDDARTA